MENEFKKIDELEYSTLNSEEKLSVMSKMTDKEKYEFLKKQPKKDLSETERLFLLKMEYVLYEEELKTNQEKKKKEWIKNILNPLKYSLEKFYTLNNTQVGEVDVDLDLKISSYLIHILSDEQVLNKIKSINPTEYVFRNSRNKIDKIENKRVYIKKEKTENLNIIVEENKEGENRIE